MSQSNLIAIDLAKDVFQVAIAGPRGKAFQHPGNIERRSIQDLRSTE